MLLLAGLPNYYKTCEIFEIKSDEIVTGMTTYKAPEYLGTTKGIIVRNNINPFRRSEFGVDLVYGFIGYFDMGTLNVDKVLIKEGNYIKVSDNKIYEILAIQELDNILTVALQGREDMVGNVWTH